MGNYGYEVKQYGCHVKQCCQITFIINNLNLIFIYKKVRNNEKIWPEIRGGIPLFNTGKYI